MAGIARVLTAVAALSIAAAAPPASAATPGWAWPVRGQLLTEYSYGGDPYAAGQHRGIDVAARVGEPVVAATGGEVRFAGTAGSSGLTVSMRTADGRFDLAYLHLRAVSVRAGETVARGERVGAVGVSGRRSATSPHLHFGVRVAGSRHGYRDPRALLPVAPRVPRVGPAPAPRPVEQPLLPARRPVAPAARPMPVPSAAWAAAGLLAALALAGLVLAPGLRHAPSRWWLGGRRPALLGRR